MASYSGTASGADLDTVVGLGSISDNPTFLNRISGIFNKFITIVNSITSEKSALDMEHYALQGGASPIGVVLHNYTDANGIQLDMVGDGIGLKIKCASNPTHRPDKPIDFVGSGDAILFTKSIVDAGGVNIGSEDVYKLGYTGEQKFITPASTPVYFKHDKPDDNSYMFQFYGADTTHKYLLNLNSKFKFYHTDGDKNTLSSNINLNIIANGTETMLITNTITHHFKDFRCYGELRIGTGIKDKNGLTGTVGQVLTANGDGTCEWK